MANKIKEGETYMSPQDSKRDLSKLAYAVITQTNFNHNRRDGLVIMEVYPRECTRQERQDHNILPVDQFNEPVSEDEYELYFSKDNSTSGNNPQKSAYTFFAEKKHEVDGKEILKYAIWESDES